MTTDNRSPEAVSGLEELLRHSPDVFEPEVDPRRRRGRRVRNAIITVVVLAIVLGVPGGYVGWALTAPVAEPTATTTTPVVSAPGPADLALPSEGASAISVSGADDYLGAGASGIWLTTGTDERRPIASITKLITALVILDARPLSGGDAGPTLTFDGADNDLYDKYYVQGATIASMPTNSSMSQRDALGMLLVPSASNYAEAVSSWAFGSQGAFLSAARRWLGANGLNGTTIVEPSGIDRRNVSTPADLIALGKLAAAHPVVADLAASPSISVPGLGSFANTNRMLGVSGITGLKTGNLGENSYNLLYTASLDVGTGAPLAVTGVMLGGFDRETVNAGVRAQLEGLRGGFHPVRVAEAGQVVGSYSTPWGSSAQIIVSETTSIFTWSDTPVTATMQTVPAVEHRDGEIVGSITWTAGPHTATSTIEIDGSIEPPETWWRLTHPDQLGGDQAG